MRTDVKRMALVALLACAARSAHGMGSIDGRWEADDEDSLASPQGPSPMALITQLQHRFGDWDKQ